MTTENLYWFNEDAVVEAALEIIRETEKDIDESRKKLYILEGREPLPKQYISAVLLVAIHKSLLVGYNAAKELYQPKPELNESKSW